MATEAYDIYAAQVDAMNAQRADILNEQPGVDRWSGPISQRFRQDPRREPSAALSLIASYLRPDDTLLDVGGGAGRYGLPLALRCKEVINVDPSPAMRGQFEAVAGEAGITNVRFVQSDWLEAEGVTGDVALVANVTYFVRDIRRFLQKLNRATRRQIIIDVHSVPPPNRTADFFPLLYGVEQRLAPSYRELLPVLWEMGILPEVRVLPAEAPFVTPTREEAVTRALSTASLSPERLERARGLIQDNFDQLFVAGAGGFQPRRGFESRELLISWETAAF